MKSCRLANACALMCFTGVTTTYAQNLVLGIKAGGNFDKTQGDHLDEKFSGHFMGGAYLGVRFTKVKVQADVLFSQSKVTTGDNFLSGFGNYLTENGKAALGKSEDGTFKMNELSIPVTIGFNIVPKLLWIHAGPQYTGVVSINDVDGFVKETKNVFKNGYISGVVGAELELPFSLNAGLRYIFGISDRNNTDVPDSWRTSHFQVHVGFSFLK